MGDEQDETDREIETEIVPPGAALVPFEPDQDVPRAHVTTRSDPSFLTHLLATADQIPQTRALRRAPPDEASSAYHSVAHHERRGPGRRMRRMI